MHFKDFIKSCDPTDVMEFDFVNDAKGDGKFPNVKNWAELRCYLYRRNACHEAINAGKRLWKKYRAARLDDLLV